jgi:predicted dehydrogenase
VLVEKPISHTLAGCDELVALSAARGLVGLVGYQFRFHPGLLWVQQLLAEGTLGRPVSVRAEYAEYVPGWHPWEDYRTSYSVRADLGGGVLLTLSHPLDYLRWLLGPVRAVSANAVRSGALEMDLPDTVQMQLAFANGVTGQLHLDYLQSPPSHQLRLVCERGRIEWDNADGSVRWHVTGESEWRHFTPPPEFERNHLFINEVAHFLNCIAGAETPRCSLADGVETLRLALAAETAAHTQQVITL